MPVPLWLRIPKVYSNGNISVSKALANLAATESVSLLDVAPTILGLVGRVAEKLGLVSSFLALRAVERRNWARNVGSPDGNLMVGRDLLDVAGP